MVEAAVEAFFEPGGDGKQFLATPYTRGPWDPRSMHAGPPSALLGHVIEAQGARDDAMIARFTVEILKPLPVAPLVAEAEVLRPGRKVELLGATLAAGGEVLARAQAWRVRTEDIGLSAGLAGRPVPPLPEQEQEADFFLPAEEFGYHTAMEWRFVKGAFLETGPATVWLRMRVPLLPGVPPSPLERVLAAADSGNGVSAAVHPDDYLFINTDLTVHLHRLPAGEWVCMDAHTTIESHGVGFATTALYDLQGPIGRGAQALFVAPRRG